MPDYKLTYFNLKGRGEKIRLIFHASGTKFVDNRIENKDWPSLKPKMPHGTLPVLEIDGKMYGQSLAMARYMARLTGLAGRSPIEELKADELVDTTSDFGKEFTATRYEKDEAKKAQMFKEFQSVTAPKYMEKFAKQLKSNGGGFFVGTSLTWADLCVFNLLDTMLPDPSVLDKYPELKTFKKKIEDIPKIKAYLKSRPKTPFLV